MDNDRYKHLFITGNLTTEKYKTPQSGGGKPKIPERDRLEHSARLLSKFDTMWAEREQIGQQRAAEQIPTREGTYLSFLSAANYELITKSLEDRGKGIRLLNIKDVPVDGNQTQIRATVYIPKGKEAYFVDKIKKYQSEETSKGKPKNAPLVNSIDDISIALLESFWTDNVKLFPDENAKWYEAWLNVNTIEKQEQIQIADFFSILDWIGIGHKANSIIFPERAIVLIHANKDQLIELMLESDLLAEFRIGQVPAGFWIHENSMEQQEWIENLIQRLEIVDSNVKICVLDSGVNNGHQLLQPLLNDANVLTVNPEWGTNDHVSHSGHGTLMAGIAGYGNLEKALMTGNAVVLSHKLCSVKILPRPKQEETPKELWGDVTAQGIARAEIQNPKITLVYCMAVTSKDGSDVGRPSSWSGAIDNLTFGEGVDQKLILISAGNLDNEDEWKDYPQINLVTTIENPGQSWNALTIGAYTNKIQVNDETFKDFTPLAKRGELSPFSSTSCIWEGKWPVKPDVVFEGGNLLEGPDHSITRHEDLELLSTSKSFNIKPFDTINATSAATAQASWFAAKIAYEYPNAWPETIRALMVHSASWKEAMTNQIGVDFTKKGPLANMLRTFGYGVPNLERALFSSESALTFIVQETIQPFGFDEKHKPVTNDIHLFDFPWPQDLLLSMGEIPVELKITLSYFIEPGAGEIGWKDKYRYQSYGLRFDLNNSGEDEDSFKKRINAAAREEDENFKSGKSGSERWILGVDNRDKGSIHSDFWKGTAADLATCHHIAVYPVIGWWRERSYLGKVSNKARYSLIVSIETPAQDVELYTTVKTMIEIPIVIAT
jgi:hypothetical protein